MIEFIYLNIHYVHGLISKSEMKILTPLWPRLGRGIVSCRSVDRTKSFLLQKDEKIVDNFSKPQRIIGSEQGLVRKFRDPGTHLWSVFKRTKPGIDILIHFPVTELNRLQILDSQSDDPETAIIVLVFNTISSSAIAKGNPPGWDLRVQPFRGKWPGNDGVQFARKFITRPAITIKLLGDCCTSLQFSESLNVPLVGGLAGRPSSSIQY